MLINNIDLSSLGIKLYDRVITSNNVKTVEDWLEGDIQPTFVRQQDSFKNIKLDFLVLAESEDSAFIKISKLTQMLKKASIKFDDMDYIFDVTMRGQANPERLKNGNFVVTYDLAADYAKGEREVYTTNANLTNAFKLNVLYYQNSTTLLAAESVTMRASSFEDNNTLASIGIDADKYQPKYFKSGVVTNLGNKVLSYENLQNLGVLIINYPPMVYEFSVRYFLDNNGSYNDLLTEEIHFTYPGIQGVTNIAQLLNIKDYKPDGCRAEISYTGEITVENLIAASPIHVFYKPIENEKSKSVTITYSKEMDDGTFEIFDSIVIPVHESDIIVGSTLGDVINLSSKKPSKYYSNGYIFEHNATEEITYETLDVAYEVRYPKEENTIFIEYYLGTYPNWYRYTTNTIKVKHKDSYDEFSVADLDIDLDKYKQPEYYKGALYNASAYQDYDSTISAGVLQIYYEPIQFEIRINFEYADGHKEPVQDKVIITALDFLNDPVLRDIIPIDKYKDEGYQFSVEDSYDGPITLANLFQASPITITYEEIQQTRTKNIILKYKQELASAFATINTSIITINEADCIGGVRLKDIFNLDLYRPEYYEKGILNGASSTVLLEFDDIDANYNIIYMASEYVTPVRYYIDEVTDTKWIGSASISYKVIDFNVDTTLFDLGFNTNLYKPSYCGDGINQYNGPVNFSALRELQSINVIYKTERKPDEDIQYPHRFLFLEHNDLGEFELQHPTWTMNHAYINTGITVDDMSKLTVIMECARVDENVPLHNVNAGYGYLFGSTSSLGSFYMRFNNQTQYGFNLTGVNTYEANAGLNTDRLVLSEENAIGFSENSGIYAIERNGYSNATFTYTNLMQSEKAPMVYPLYLFANNNGNHYQDGLAGIGIYGCRIYYDGILVRDMIPVQFYDKIGDQVAPSNCLYDKVTGTFFEDGTGQNSFNIRDDDRYLDVNLQHKIGNCFVQYYKGDEYIQTVQYYFRGDEFPIDDIYEKFKVDSYQPAYYKSGEIENFKNLIFDFDNMNGSIYKVIYPEQKNTILVNYYGEIDGQQNLLQSEIIPISEKDFYQVPTFGDIVRINKYKPEGFETDFEYTGSKVSLARVIEGSPYNIVYKPIEGEIINYTTTVKYIKKVYGLRTYETIATETLTFDQSDFRDGEYIDFYINKNLHKPENYYLDGNNYQWYEMDERIDSPDKLKDEYIISYMPKKEFVDINYYKNSIAEENKIASTSVSFQIDQFEPGYKINLIDTLPNEYINKYKPANCNGGVLQNPTEEYDFEGLVALDEIVIIYTEKEAPHDPESASYDQKILYWGEVNKISYTDECFHNRIFTGGRIPYIDLGYKPKEIGRLRVEIKAYARPYGIVSLPGTGGMLTSDYLKYFGYYGPTDAKWIGVTQYKEYNSDLVGPGAGAVTSVHGSARSLSANYSINANGSGRGTEISPDSVGCFAIGCRAPVASGWVYTVSGPQYIDGQRFYGHNSTYGESISEVQLKQTGISADYRKGYYSDTDDNYEPIPAYNNHGFSVTYREFDNGENSTIPQRFQPYVCWDRTAEELIPTLSSCGNPYTVTLDAYNSYGACWRDEDSNTPVIYNFDESKDNPSFKNVCQPQGTLSLFQTTNPTTGKVNIMAFNPSTFPYLGNIQGGLALSKVTNGNIYTDVVNSSYEEVYYTKVDTQYLELDGKEDGKEPVKDYESSKGSWTMKTTTRNINFADFYMAVYPQMTGCAVWSVKIYDRDRLVRDMIPVAKGDMIYDYVMPENGLFDLVTEIFFGNANEGGTYEYEGYIAPDTSGMNHGYVSTKRTIKASDVYPLNAILDPTIYGKTVTNYYDYDYSFIANQFVDVPVWYNPDNERIEDILRFNDYKPDDFHLDGLLDLDKDLSFETMTLKEIYDMGLNNVYYKLKTFTKTVVYYRDNVRIASKDLFYSLQDIDNARTIADLGIDVDLYYDSNFAHGRVVFDESIIESDDMKAFIDAPSPIVVYDKLSAENLLYVEYYRGGAYDDNLITIDEESPNYLDCNLTAKVLNPHGAIKYFNHYHTALYEDEKFDYFIPYQVRVKNKYAGIHRGPARKYQTLAMIIERDTYTIIEERNGWGRLKEYPIGWILLNQTEPMVGPGQNPEFDVPDAETATIPFKTEISINKMTIDRLWCYSPDVESWIKAEDLSYNQAGKLYNGLGIEVINLDEVDWDNANSLESVGIILDAYYLPFHNQSDYTYEGEYNKESFATIHDLNIVYPETIYNYNCHYYKYHKSAENELGRAGFSCTISDWNPDWDVFIEEYRKKVGEGYGEYKIIYNINESNNRVYISPDITSSIVTTITVPTNKYVLVKSTSAVIKRNDQYWIRILTEDGISGYVRYIASCVVTPYTGDDYVNRIKLYRDTDITLTWDYFGFDRNLFKPDGFGEGIYMWNPRSWDKDNIKFTFEELIRCGTQYVFYPVFEPETYKLWSQHNYLGAEKFENGKPGYYYRAVNNDIKVNLKGSHNYFNAYDNIEYPIYDIYTSGEVQGTWDFIASDYAGANPTAQYHTKTWNSDTYISSANGALLGLVNPWVTLDVRGNEQINGGIGDRFVWNFSNHRTSPTVVYGIGKEDMKYYALNPSGQASSGHQTWERAKWIKIEDNTNLKNLHINDTDNKSYKLDDIGMRGVLYDTIAYENFMMIHYWTPVPKGLWYVYNGEELRIPDNGLFDLLTGEFVRSYRMEDGPVRVGESYTVTPTVDGNDFIYLRSHEIKEKPYNYFSDWNFDSTECKYAVSVNSERWTNEKPDEYSTRVRKVKPYLVVPATKYTSDEANRVVGEWYFCGDQWINSANTNIISMDFTPEKQTICLVATGQELKGSLAPGENGTISYGVDAQVLVSTAESSDYYFVGDSWIPKEITHNNVVEENLNYVVALETNYYRYPLEDNQYKIGTYTFGDRITVLKSTAKDRDWLYTGQGWIKRTSTNLSIVE